MNTSYTILFLILGAGLALGAHIARNFAERRSREMYRELTAPKNRPKFDLDNRRGPGSDMWDEIRPIVGGWGCLVIVLNMIQGIGVLSVIFSAMYLILQLFAS